MVIKLDFGTILLAIALISISVVYMGGNDLLSDENIPQSEIFSSPLQPDDFQPDDQEESEWNFGGHKNAQKWTNQMKQRSWSKEEITEAVKKGERFPATNSINPSNGATRFVHPGNGKSVVIDNVTQELLHVGKEGFLY